MIARRIPLLLTLLACAIMAASIAFVFVLVIIGLVSGGIDLPGQPRIADADTDALGAVAALAAAVA